ncbi:MAG: lytic transglycosylase domain-containing protein [Lysobacter sp.]|nr:lytic transglycosylase domain-containing protein [Lysobacter sp.]
MRGRTRRFALAVVCSASMGMLATPAASAAAGPGAIAGPVAAAEARTGHDIYRQFRDGLSAPACPAGVSERWRTHFAAAPGRLAQPDEGTLALFGYVLDALEKASLPSEYALIPFVESGYKPDARSPLGPAGMWQMIKLTARNHKVPIRGGYDGRLSPVDSTRAAVRYLKTLHGMFAGDWRLAAMAYNAGEYRILGALRKSGQVARDAKPEALPGVAGITHAYVRKLQALACLLEEAEDQEQWMQALDRPVPRLEAVPVATDVTRVDVWADANGRDPRRLRRLNPAFVAGRIRHDGGAVHLLVPTPAYAALVVDEAPDAETQPAIARAEGAESTVNGSPTQVQAGRAAGDD